VTWTFVLKSYSSRLEFHRFGLLFHNSREGVSGSPALTLTSMRIQFKTLQLRRWINSWVHMFNLKRSYHVENLDHIVLFTLSYACSNSAQYRHRRYESLMEFLCQLNLLSFQMLFWLAIVLKVKLLVFQRKAFKLRIDVCNHTSLILNLT